MVISESKAIRKKLMAATAMLLVAAIMLISSSYAWFTLSTKPEVTGITTTVGANGNLEIALATTDSWKNPDTEVKSSVGSSMSSTTKENANITWGNLVDLGLDTYGLGKISLLPSRLNISGSAELGYSVSLLNPLMTPSYGYDGRITDLTANTSTALYNATDKNFPMISDSHGVLAVGTSTSMTERQISYRNAKVDLANADSNAALYAAQSLNENGSDLANIIIQKAVATSENVTYTQNDVAVIETVVLKLEDSYKELKKALTAAVLGLAASKTSEDAGMSATAYDAFETAMENGYKITYTKDENDVVTGGTLKTIATDTTTSIEFALTETLAKDFYELEEIGTNIESAKKEITSLKSITAPTWEQLRKALDYIVNPDKVTVNGLTTSQLKDDLQVLVDAVLDGQGIQVQMTRGSGVYADIAEFCGDYSAQITLENISYSGVTVKKTTAKMTTVTESVTTTDADGKTTTTTYTPYLDTISSAVKAAEAPVLGGVSTPTMTDFYGYMVDLYFRTNAATSNLLLQTSAEQRIYSGETGSTSENTQGAGSNMEFSSSSLLFSDDDMKNLMDGIRVVFMDGTGKVLAFAKLDMSTAAQTTTGIKADLKLYEATVKDGVLKFTTVQATVKEGNTTKYVFTNAKGETIYGVKSTAADSTETITYTDKDGNSYDPAASGAVTEVMEYVEVKDQIITALNKNVAEKVSVLVYLDGDVIDNADVAASVSSMTGKLNLQFASDATLVPMENSALKNDISTNNSTNSDAENTN